MSNVLGIVISKEEYDKYLELKKKNTPIKKTRGVIKRYPVCNYAVDNKEE